MPTFTVRGHKVRTASPRRYIVVSTYQWPPTVVKRTDNLEVARRERRRDGVNRLILDARTGDELREGMTKWSVLGPRQFVDKRSRLTRDSGVVYQHVRAYRGVIVRKEDGKLRYANCLHAHNKPGAARRCAEREARKRNRLGDYWETEE